jgi:hypothetical protein
METTQDLLTLAAFAGGFLVIGAGVGLGIYHFGHGWFISRTSREHLEGAVAAAERHTLRRAERRHNRQREKRVFAEAPETPAGRHLAR